MLTEARGGRTREGGTKDRACTAQPSAHVHPSREEGGPASGRRRPTPCPAEACSASAGPQGGHPTTLSDLISTPVHTQWSQRCLFLLGAAVRPDGWVSEESQHFPVRLASYGFLRPGQGRVPGSPDRRAGWGLPSRMGSAVQDLSPPALKAAPPTWGLGGSDGASRGRGWGSTPGIPGPQGQPDGQSHLRPQ